MAPRLTVSFGLLLGLAVFAWQVGSAALLGGTPLFVPVATGIEVALLVTLFARLPPGASRARATAGALTSALGAAMVFGGSLLTSTVLFPGLLASLGPDAPGAVAAAAAGFVGTLLTGVITSGALAWLQRGRVA
jgi:hypothetical protein